MKTKYEYKVVKHKIGLFKHAENLEKEINKWVEEGWEVFKVEPLTLGGSWNHTLLIFRRGKKK